MLFLYQSIILHLVENRAFQKLTPIISLFLFPVVPGVLEDLVGLMVGHLISSSLEEDLREVGEDREVEEEAVTRLEVEEETSGMHPISGML